MVSGEISINSFSKKLKTSRATVYRWISGDALPDPNSVIDISNVLEIKGTPEMQIFLSEYIKSKNMGEIFKEYIKESSFSNLS
jgi:hypothetical protein